MDKKTLKQLSLISVLTLCANYASGADTMNISATTAISCTITAAPMDFGQYNGIDKTVTTNITVDCSSGTAAYSLAADNGQHYTAMGRNLMCGNNQGVLSYNLLKPGSLTPWGQYADSIIQNGSPAENPRVYTITGQIPPQPITQGNLSCSDVVTIIFTAQ